VGWRDRGRRERNRVDLRENVVAKVGAEDGLDLRERHRLHVVDEMAELLDVSVRKQVGPRRQELSELDVRSTELLQRLPEALRARPRRVAMSYDADLGENADDAAASCDPSNGQRTASPLKACAHMNVLTKLSTEETPGRPRAASREPPTLRMKRWEGNRWRGLPT